MFLQCVSHFSAGVFYFRLFKLSTKEIRFKSKYHFIYEQSTQKTRPRYVIARNLLVSPPASTATASLAERSNEIFTRYTRPAHASRATCSCKTDNLAAPCKGYARARPHKICSSQLESASEKKYGPRHNRRSKEEPHQTQSVMSAARTTGCTIQRPKSKNVESSAAGDSAHLLSR